MGKIAKALEKAEIGTTGEGRVSDDGSIDTADIILTRDSGKRESGLKKNEREKDLRSGHWDERLSLAMSGSTETSESFRVLRSRILYPDDETKIYRTILIASTAPREGKSFVCANLGLSLAQGVDQRALLVDCDLRRPTLARLFGLSSDRGLSDYLQNGTDLANLIQKTSVDKMTLLASGRSPVNPSELLGSAKMHELVLELAERYDDRFII
ncbi:MAG: hypothetical protein Q8R88_17555, partial [Desulfoprunum sp.]|nr:hypothetical protein [Desulfoprunum sp.]